MSRKGGAMSQAFSPNTNRRAIRIWTILLVKAPMMLIPIREIFPPKSCLAAIMASPLAKEPEKEKRKAMERNDPWISA